MSRIVMESGTKTNVMYIYILNELRVDCKTQWFWLMFVNGLVLQNMNQNTHIVEREFIVLTWIQKGKGWAHPRLLSLAIASSGLYHISWIFRKMRIKWPKKNSMTTLKNVITCWFSILNWHICCCRPVLDKNITVN